MCAKAFEQARLQGVQPEIWLSLIAENGAATAAVQTITTTVTTAAGSTRSAAAIFSGTGYRQVRVFNEGTATVWIEFGGSQVAAVNTADMPIAAGATEIFTVPAVDGGTWVAVWAAGATGNVYFTPGSGM